MDSKGKIKKIPEISGKRITLRKLRFSDSKDIYRNIRDKEVVKWLLNIPHPYALKSAVKFIRKAHCNIRSKKAYVFGVVLRKENKVIGTITLSKFDYKNRNAEVGYWLGKRYWRQGLMSEAVKLMLDFAFRQLKLHRISAGLFEENIASNKLLGKAGFKPEGKIRQSRFKYNRWHNELRYGILYSEFKSK